MRYHPAHDSATKLSSLRSACSHFTGTLIVAAILFDNGGSQLFRPRQSRRPPHLQRQPLARHPAVRVYVTNEASGDLTVIDAATQTVIATAPLGKRPRGIQAEPRRQVAVRRAQRIAASAGPGVDPKTLPPPDRNADGIGEVDADTYKVKRVIHAGADPEQLAVSADGTRLYVANEDTARLSVVDVASGTVVAAVKIGEEPEGVTIRPDGKVVYVTSEGDGAVFAIDTADQQGPQAHPGRPAAAIDRVPARRLARLRLARERGRDRGLRRASSTSSCACIQLEGKGNTPKPRPMGIAVAPGRIDGLRDRRIVRPPLLDRSGEERATGVVRGRPAAVGHRAAAGRQDGLHRERTVERRVGDRPRHEGSKKIPAGNRPWGIAVLSR